MSFLNYESVEVTEIMSDAYIRGEFLWTLRKLGILHGKSWFAVLPAIPVKFMGG